MQYETNNKRNNSSFYLIIAICVVAIGLVSYLAAVKTGTKNKNDTKKDKESEFSSDTSSYNSDIEDPSSDITISEDNAQITENTVSDVPYEEPVEEKQTFVMPTKGNIIKNFSDTSLQYDKTYGDLRMHKGIDISCEENAKIVSASKGTISDISDTADYGKVITIDHGNGLTVKYCGLASVCVTKGEEVSAGTLIGTSKNPTCECMDENHIHIECTLNGEAVSPVSAFGF